MTNEAPKGRRKSNGKKLREAMIAKAILLLNAQGYTIRQIIEELKKQGIFVNSTDTVHRYLKTELGKASQANLRLAEELKAGMVEQTSELMGILAPSLVTVTIEKKGRKKVETVTPNLEVIDRMLRVMDRRAIYVGFSNKVEHSGQLGIDLNDLRTGRKKVAEKAKELEIDPNLTGRVR
jgi:hypothetical protein